MAAPTITPLPSAPDRADGATAFDANATAWAAALDGWTTEVQAVGDFCDVKAGEALAAALGGTLPPLTGHALKMIRVNGAETAAEFVDLSLPTSAWTAGVDVTEAVVSPADISAAITALTPPPPPGLGVGQTWSNPARSNNVAYQNTTGRPIFVVISVYTNKQVYVSADAVTWITLCSVGASPSESGTGFVVPNGYFYKTNGKRTWSELR